MERKKIKVQRNITTVPQGHCIPSLPGEEGRGRQSGLVLRSHVGAFPDLHISPVCTEGLRDPEDVFPSSALGAWGKQAQA